MILAVFGWLGLFLWLLSLLLLVLLQFLLLLVVFLLHLLQLLLLALLGLFLALLVGVLLLQLLILLDLLLLEFLALLILLLAQTVELLLVALLKLRVGARPRSRRAVVVSASVGRMIGAAAASGPLGAGVHVLSARRQRRRPGLLCHAHTRQIGLALAELGSSHRPSIVALDRLHLPRDRSRGRRRRILGDDCACRDVGRRRDARCSARTKETTLLRSNRRGQRSAGSGGHFLRIDPDHIAADGLSRCERGPRSGGHGVGHTLVLIGDVGDVSVYVDVGIDVGNLSAVDDRGVVDVDVLNVARSDPISRAEDITRTKREPGHTCGHSANRNANSEVRTAHPGHQRRSVHRPHIADRNHRRPRCHRHPAPYAADNDPASVVEGREAPGRIVYPRPSPRRNPDPVAVAVRRPADDGGVREPDCAVLRHRAPAAVIIEILVADHVVRNVAGRSRAVPASVAVAAPTVEVVIAGISLDVSAQLIASPEGRTLSGMNRISRTAAGDFALSVANIDNRRVAVFVHIDAVGARAQNVEGKIRGVHFEHLALVDAADADIHRTFGKADLYGAIVQVQKGETGLFAEANGVGIDAQLGAPASVGPKLVARSHRAVDHGVRPLVAAGRSEGNRPAGVAQARCAAWRILAVILSRRARR